MSAIAVAQNVCILNYTTTNTLNVFENHVELMNQGLIWGPKPLDPIKAPQLEKMT